MNAKAKIDIVSDDSELVKALNRATKLVEKLARANKKLKDESKASSKVAVSGIGRMAKSLGTAVAGYASLATAIQLVNKELERQRTLESKSLQLTKTTGAAQIEVATLLGTGTTNKEKTQFFADLKKVAGDRSQLPFLNAAKSILSATQTDRPLTLETLRAIRPFSLGNPDLLTQLGGVIPGISKSAGLTTEQAASFAFSTLGQARIESAEQLQAFGPAFSAGRIARAPDDTLFRQAQITAALASTFGALGEDVTGKTSGGAASALQTGLERAFPQGRTFEERFAAAKADPRIAEEVLRTGFRQQTRPVAEALFSGKGGGFAEQQFRDILAELPINEAGARRLGEFVQTGTPEIRALGRGVRQQGASEQFLGRTSLQLKAAIRQELIGEEGAITQAGGAVSQLNPISLRLGAQNLRERLRFARSLIAQEIQVLELPTQAIDTGIVQQQGRALGQETRAKIARFKAAEESLDGIEKEMKLLNAKTPQIRTNAEGDE